MHSLHYHQIIHPNNHVFITQPIYYIHLLNIVLAIINISMQSTNLCNFASIYLFVFGIIFSYISLKIFSSFIVSNSFLICLLLILCAMNMHRQNMLHIVDNVSMNLYSIYLKTLSSVSILLLLNSISFAILLLSTGIIFFYLSNYKQNHILKLKSHKIINEIFDEDLN